MFLPEAQRKRWRKHIAFGRLSGIGTRFGTERPLVRIQSPRPLFPPDPAKQRSETVGNDRTLTETNGIVNGSRTEA